MLADTIDGVIGVEAHDQLVVEAGRVRNRFHTLLLVLAPATGRAPAICGVGGLTAAKLLGETHSLTGSPRRPRSPPTPAPRPSRCPAATPNGIGSVAAAPASSIAPLFTIAMCQARWDPNARAYLARKRTEGKSPTEARRCLKRHLANVVYRAMVADARALQATPPSA
jgi:hypothetical protein